MEAMTIERRADMLKLAATPIRLRALMMIRDGGRGVGRMAAEIGVSQFLLSRHLGALKLAGLAERTRHGDHQVTYTLTDAGARLLAAAESI